jgi:hypothetical protein
MSLPPLTRLTDDVTAYSADVTTLMPDDWAAQILECSRAHSRWQVLDGASVTSRETHFRDESSPKVGVVTGDVIADTLPWLDALYRGRFLEMANSLGVGAFEPCTELRAATNINATPRGARYEWHVDSNPLTGLLFATSHLPDEGGQLIFRPDPQTRPDETWTLQVSPKAGTLLLFDAREAAHVVTRLEADLRLSVPMNYYLQGRQHRPEDLDGYLYT